jgi:tetratricopeptide (TPR) repeat protein
MWLGAAALAVLVVISVLAIRLAGRAPYVTIGWFWYVVTLTPVIGIVQVGTQSMADRYTYLPLLGPFLTIVWGLHALAQRRPPLRIAAGAAVAASVLLCAVAARAQVDVWKDNETLWTHTLAVTHDNYRAEYAIGTILGQQGRTAEAMAHFTEAVRLEPGFAEAHFNLGIAELNLGHLSEAEDHFNRALRIHPDDANTRYNLGLTLVRMGRIDDAVVQYREALRLQPSFAVAENGLGFAFQTKGFLDDAAAHYSAAIAIDPSFADAYSNRGFVRATQNKVAEAIDDFRMAIRLKPDFEAAHLSLGIALGAIGRKDEAIQELQTVLKLNPSNAGALRALDYLRGGKD